MKFNDVVSGGVLLALSLLILSTVKDYPDIPGQNIGPGAFPGLLAALLAVCAVLLIAIRTWRLIADPDALAPTAKEDH